MKGITSKILMLCFVPIHSDFGTFSMFGSSEKRNEKNIFRTSQTDLSVTNSSS